MVNTDAKTYSVIVGGSDSNPNSGNISTSFSIVIAPNSAPEITTAPTDAACIIAHFPLNHIISKSNFNEPESEAISYSFVTNETSKDSWISMSTNDTHLTFSGTPSNTQLGNYTVTLTLTDIHPGNTNTTTFEICVNENNDPNFVGTATAVTNGQVGIIWSYVFDKSWVSDPESETLTYTGSLNPDPGWITFTQNLTHLKGEGTPNDNAHAQSYEFTVMTTDPHSDVNDNNFTITFTIIANDPPTIGTMADKSLLAPDGLTWSYSATLTSDPETLSYTRALEVDGSTTIPSWLTYDLSTYSFSIVTSSNAIKGDHTITVIITDAYNTPVSKSFTLTVNENLAPQKNKVISSKSIVNYNLLTIMFEDIDVLFTDPDGRPMTPKVTQANGDPLPLFLAFNAVSNTLSGTPEFMHVGDWLISYIAVDDHNLEGAITFKVTVKRKLISLFYSRN